jgi:hypothetical protein
MGKRDRSVKLPNCQIWDSRGSFSRRAHRGRPRQTASERVSVPGWPLHPPASPARVQRPHPSRASNPGV